MTSQASPSKTDTHLLSHGMSTEPVPSDWPAMTEAEVARVLQHYRQVGTLETLVWHSPRPFSSGCVVKASAMDVFIKRHHHSVRDIAGLMEEHAFIQHLRRRGFATVEILSTNDGATAVADGQWTYEIHRAAPDVDLYRDELSWTPFGSPVHANEAGKALALLHDAAADYAAPARKVQMLVSSLTIFSSPDPLPALQRYIDQRPALADYLATRQWRSDTEQVLLPLHQKLRPYLDALTPLWTHNDWHGSNLLWSDDTATAGVAGVIDFGLSDRTCALADLAIAIERNLIPWLEIQAGQAQPAYLEALDAMLDGYVSVRPLTTRQTYALAALLPLVHAEFALAEVDYFHGITRSEHNAALAYDAYYLGHARWFSSADGQALLARIIRRANA